MGVIVFQSNDSGKSCRTGYKTLFFLCSATHDRPQRVGDAGENNYIFKKYTGAVT